MKTYFCVVTCFITILFLSACVNYTGSAPVRDINTHRVGHDLFYTVQAGETLYAVAWRYEMDYQKLAKLNGLRPPYAIHPGQKIRLSGVLSKAALTKKTKIIKIKQVKKSSHKKTYTEAYENNQPVRKWLWPAKGKVVARFSGLNKGINISGKYNEPVISTAKGQVVYAGHGIRGYGNLLIVKHNKTYLSAYAHNSQLLVKTGDNVRAGQQIARMGMSTSGRVLLHFEIRRNGRPVNPTSFALRNFRQ